MLFDKWYNITPKLYYKKRPRDSGRFVLLRRKKIIIISGPDYFYETDREKLGRKGLFLRAIGLVFQFGAHGLV
jgi:hypothetical protein